jgi:hypothetical protein
MEDAMFITTDEMLRPGFCGVIRAQKLCDGAPLGTIDMTRDAKLTSGALMKFPSGFAKTYEEGDTLWVFPPELATDLVNKDILSDKGWFYGADGRLYSFNKESNFEEFKEMLKETYSSDIRSFVADNREAQAEECLALMKLLVNDQSDKSSLLSEAIIEYGRDGAGSEDGILHKYSGTGLNEKELESALGGIRRGMRFHKALSLVGKVLMVLIVVLMSVVGAHMLVK